MEFTFPFSTCEKVQEGIAQPYSTAANAIACALLLYFLIQSETVRARILLSTLLAFEAFHTFSHAVHLPGETQQSVAHLLAYCINAGFLYYFADITNKAPSNGLWLALSALIVLDVFSYMTLPIVAYMGTQAAMFITSYLFYYKLLPAKLKMGLVGAVALSSSIILLVWNEMHNCENMMRWWAAPYHLLIEIIGICLFGLIGYVFQ